MKLVVGIVGLSLPLFAACGEDKNYGDPIEDPAAVVSATSAVSNASLLAGEMATNDSSLLALNSLSGNLNLLGGAKIQQRADATARLDPDVAHVDEACVVVGTTSIEYNDCDFLGNTVTGSVNRDGTTITADLTFNQVTEDITVDIDIDANIDVTSAAIQGYVDFGIRMEAESITVVSALDGDFDVVLDSAGCAVDGQLEVHAAASAQGRSDSLWVLAEYGPTCGDVVVR